MNNTTLTIKIKQRLNKLDSKDYDNLECWMLVEAFNKAQVEWCRRQIHGYNLFKEGDESSKMRLDDLQILLESSDEISEINELYTALTIPKNYMSFKRVRSNFLRGCCDALPLIIYLDGEDNVDVLLRNEMKKPSASWGETFATLYGNNVRIYTNGELTLDEPELIYYRLPRYIQIKDCKDPYTAMVSTEDVECEFKDDIVEVIIDVAASIISGDIESLNQMQRNQQNSEMNN